VRKFLNRAFPLAAGLCALVACGVLLAIVSAILLRGLPAISWGFFTEQIRLVGAAGGIFHNLMGTLLLITTAFLVSAPVAVGVALVHRVYLPAGRARRRLALLLYILNGVPSILFGLFGLIVFVKYFGWGKSWLAGGILLGVMILPTVTVALLERMAALPASYLEAAAGLGLSPSQIIWSVILPQSLGGLVTGSLLGLARAAGETAPILFTATVFAGATFPHAIKESPVLSLPYHIFILAQDSFDPAVGAKMWGSALVLLGLVFLLSLIALPLRLRIHEEARHG
jgi:phosphate transport system permease protein